MVLHVPIYIIYQISMIARAIGPVEIDPGVSSVHGESKYQCFAGLPEMQAMLPSGNGILWWFNGILMAISMDLWSFNGM